MLTRLQQQFGPPTFDDDEQNRVAHTLFVIQLTLITAGLIISAVTLIAGYGRTTASLLLGCAAMMIALWLNRRGYTRSATYLVILALLSLVTFLLLNGQGVHDIAIMLYPVLIMIASLLLTRRAFLTLIGVMLGVIGFTVLVEMRGGVGPVDPTQTGWVDFAILSAILLLAAVTARFLANSLVLSLQRARQNEQALAASNAQLRQAAIQRQRIEARLREREERYRLISEVMSDYTFSTVVDRQGAMQLDWVAGAFEKITGYTYEEYVARGGWRAALYPADVEQDAQDMAALQANQPVITEIRTVMKNGSLRWVRVYAHPVWDKTEARLAGIYGAVQDITERRQAEDALRESEDRFRSLVQNSQDVITVHDQNGIVLYESPSAARVLGYAPGFFIGKSPFDFIPPEEVPDMKRAFYAVARRQNSSLAAEYRFYRADGALVYLEALGANLLDHPGVRGIVITSRDVTERKRAEGALRRYLERLAILHEIDQAILAAKSIEEIADAALSRIQRSVPSWRVKVSLFDFETGLATVVASYREGAKLPAGERLPLAVLGPAIDLQPGELFVINDLSELLAPSASQRRQISEGARSSIDAPLIVLGRQIGLLSVDAAQWDAFHGEWTEVVREVADQLAVAIQNARLLEQTRRHAYELEERVAERTRELAAANERLTELDRLKSKFVSDVSHELRTPIANLKLHVELLEHGQAEKHAHYLTVVKQQARRLGQLVDDILNLSRLEMSRERMALGPVDLNFVVEQIVAAQQPRAEAAGLTLSFEPLPQLPAVQGEVNQLAQVVTNLITNALNYTAVGAVRVGTSQAAGEACLQVEDTGMGIDPEDLPNIFDRFYRGRRSQRSETPGTGLGLAIVKEIVDLHGGRIEVNSQVRQGTVFRVWLPLFGERDIV